MKDIRAVLFDMDGLLIDDERINIGSCCEMAEIMGFTIDPLDIARHCMGATRETVIDCYRAILPADVDVKAFFEAKNKLLLKHFEELGFPPRKSCSPGCTCMASHAFWPHHPVWIKSRQGLAAQA